ncbi:hypothetical protein TcasGA2_TC034499 [Tribolium castaneum]|uniref:Uncharacterized protein n=1 Tax=Tribolium castaneum TaxID=7070 RepID=A0A139WA75_TRICA|nr:hypothetical protein TcasGA2_TC034499 [Tribolium castaneum]
MSELTSLTTMEKVMGLGSIWGRRRVGFKSLNWIFEPGKPA